MKLFKKLFKKVQDTQIINCDIRLKIDGQVIDYNIDLRIPEDIKVDFPTSKIETYFDIVYIHKKKL